MKRRCKHMPIALAVVVTIACDSSPATPPPGDETLIWAAELEVEGDLPLGGSLEVESSDSELLAHIQLTGGAAEAQYEWYLGSGAECGEEAARLGEPEDYPILQLDEDGEGSA